MGLEPLTGDALAIYQAACACENSAPKTKKQHRPLTPAQRAFVEQTRIRHAGCTPEGEFVSRELLERDIDLVRAMEECNVIDPIRIKRELDQLDPALEEAQGDWSRLDPKKFTFIYEGGHINCNSSDMLLAMMEARKKGYILLQEFVPRKKLGVFNPENCVPFAYNYGFLSMPMYENGILPIAGSDLPSLDAKKVDDNGMLAEASERNILMWRATVLRDLAQVMSMYRQKNIFVPDEVLKIDGASGFRGLGANNAFKPAVVGMAEVLGRKYMTYNAGSIGRPKEQMDAKRYRMENRAVRGSNAGVFDELLLTRRHIDIIRIWDDVIAHMYWTIFSNKAKAVLAAERDSGSVLMTKGGRDIDQLVETGRKIGALLGRHHKI